MTQGVLKTHGICLMMYFKKIIGMLVHFFLLHGYFRRKKNLTALKSNSNTVWFNFQTYIYIYIYILIFKPV